jgi:hypothetical protein
MEGKISDKYKVYFFAGGETRDERFNIFTGSFIRLMTKIMKEDLKFIKGTYFRYLIMNVIWALNNAQRPIANQKNKEVFMTAFRHIKRHLYL